MVVVDGLVDRDVIEDSTLDASVQHGVRFCCTKLAVTYGVKNWRKHEAAKMDHGLKLEMLGRGMGAEEIERVLAARAVGKQEA
jgi:hypothetical protein